MSILALATRNTHKVDEIRAVLGGRFSYVTLRDLPGTPDPAEIGTTFAANARIKAEALARWLLNAPRSANVPPVDWVLADDSGLEVDALDGAPGVQSARFAATEFGLSANAPDGANNAKLLGLLAHVPVVHRTGRFRCALALTRVDPDLATVDFDGTCPGRIGLIARGAHGFGYDPLFTPDGHTLTFAELGEETKNRISHRARALDRLRDWLDARGTSPAPDL